MGGLRLAVRGYDFEAVGDTPSGAPPIRRLAIPMEDQEIAAEIQRRGLEIVYLSELAAALGYAVDEGWTEEIFAAIERATLEQRLDNTVWRMGFAGDTFNTAWYARATLPKSRGVAYVTALGDDPWSDEMLAFWTREGVGTGLVQRDSPRSGTRSPTWRGGRRCTACGCWKGRWHDPGRHSRLLVRGPQPDGQVRGLARRGRPRRG